MLIEEMTTFEIAEKVNDESVVILPLGATEEHGAHLPVSTDNIQPIYISKIVAERTGAFVAPFIPYGVCSSTRNFSGTLSISFDTLRAMVYEIITRLVSAGFKKIIVLSGHAGSGHMMALSEAGKMVLDEHDVKIMVLSDYYLVDDIRGLEIPPNDGHAGFIETSRIMAIRPDLVKGKGEAFKPEFPPYMVLKSPEKYFPSGVMGDPNNASKEAGEKINAFLVEKLVGLVETLRLE